MCWRIFQQGCTRCENGNFKLRKAPKTAFVDCVSQSQAALLPPIVTLLLLPVCITASSPQFMSTFHIFWRENKIRIQRAKTKIRNSRIQGFNWMTCNRGLPCIFKISQWVIFVVLLVLCSLSKFPQDLARCFIFLFEMYWKSFFQEIKSDKKKPKMPLSNPFGQSEPKPIGFDCKYQLFFNEPSAIVCNCASLNFEESSCWAKYIYVLQTFSG